YAAVRGAPARMMETLEQRTMVTFTPDPGLNGKLDSGEVGLLTDASGNYSFGGVGAGTYKIRAVLQSGFIQTNPTNKFGNNATLASGQMVTGKNFGVDN